MKAALFLSKALYFGNLIIHALLLQSLLLLNITGSKKVENLYLPTIIWFFNIKLI